MAREQASNPAQGTLVDIIVEAFLELLRGLFLPIEGFIEMHGDSLLQLVLGTPHPDAVFDVPSNAMWPEMHEFYWETIIPLSLTLYGIVIGLVIFLEGMGRLFSGYHRAKLKRRAVSGLFGILSWWWMAAISLRFTATLTEILRPSLSDVSLFQTLSFTGLGLLGIVIALTVDFTLFALVGLVYLVRRFVLYLYVPLMPILLVLWIPGLGPLAPVARLMKRLGQFYVPFLFMTVPVALLFRVGEVLGRSVEVSAGGFLRWLLGIVVPVLAVVFPLLLFWQASAIFFLGERGSRQVSTDTARDRVETGREKTQDARQGLRNSIRGAKGKPAKRADGQYLLDSGDSRGYAFGTRLRRSLSGDSADSDSRSSDSDSHGLSRMRTDAGGQQAIADEQDSGDSPDSTDSGSEGSYSQTNFSELLDESRTSDDESQTSDNELR